MYRTRLKKEMAGSNQQRKFTFSCEINSLRNIRNNKEVKETGNVQDMKIFSCAYCNHISKYKENIERHEQVLDRNEINIFSCELCPFTSKWKGDITRHEKREYGNEIILFSCGYCKYTPKQKCNVKAHEKREHGNEKIIFSCGYCNHTSKYKAHLKTHEKTQHGNEINLFSCRYCNHTSKWKQNIDKHEKCNMKHMIKCSKRGRIHYLHVNSVLLFQNVRMKLRDWSKCNMEMKINIKKKKKK